MKKLTVLLLVAIVLLFSSCGKKISVSLETSRTEGFGYNQDQDTSEATVGLSIPELPVSEFPDYIEADYPEGIIGFKETDYMVAGINDVYYNAADYEGKTVGYEGMVMYFDSYLPDGTMGEKVCAIARYGPGCCGDDGVVGFQIVYSGEEVLEEGEWVRVMGNPKLKIVDEIYGQITLEVISLEKIVEHGEENVYH